MQNQKQTETASQEADRRIIDAIDCEREHITPEEHSALQREIDRETASGTAPKSRTSEARLLAAAKRVVAVADQAMACRSFGGGETLVKFMANCVDLRAAIAQAEGRAE